MIDLIARLNQRNSEIPLYIDHQMSYFNLPMISVNENKDIELGIYDI